MYIMIASASESELLPFIAFSIAVFSALRLAIFNVDEGQTDSFRGLNTPANTIFITSVPLLHDRVGAWLYEPATLVAITLIFSFLLTSPIRFFAFKFKNFGWKGNETRFTFLLLSGLMLIVLQLLAIPIIIILYIVISLLENVLSGRKS